jgi:2-dehydro-3-deoxyphosphogluconate aldolase / (4S)-4-hydroxy-2-oxoglutarate aldolase
VGIKLMPTGGVDLETLPAFTKAGAAGFGIGSPLFDKARMEAADWGWLEARARAFVGQVCPLRE